MPHESSVTRARYAISLLRDIRQADLRDVKQLTRSLASEYPLVDTPADIIEFEVRAIAAFRVLDGALSGIDGLPEKSWVNASEAAEAWEASAAQFR